MSMHPQTWAACLNLITQETPEIQYKKEGSGDKQYVRVGKVFSTEEAKSHSNTGECGDEQVNRNAY